MKLMTAIRTRRDYARNIIHYRNFKDTGSSEISLVFSIGLSERPFYIGWFILAWTIWLLLADKSRWREILPVCIFASFLGQATDSIMSHYPLWEYIGFPLLANLADDLGIYPVVVYLFIQWLPNKPSLKNMVKYWLVWTTVSIAIELIYKYYGYITYHQFWNTWYSYAADWFLYWLFYSFHKILKLEKLSSNK